MRIILTTALSAFVGLALSTPALAQSDHGVVVHGTVSTAIFANGSPLALGGSIGYRMNRAFGLELELFSIPDLDSRERPIPYLTRAPFVSDVESSLTAFMTNVRLEAPTTSRRLLPFAVIGGGVANVSRSYSLNYPGYPPFPGSPLPAAQGGPGGLPAAIFVAAQLVPYSSSSLHMALSIGGGLSILWTDHVSIDVDGRALQLVGEEGGSIGRFGAGASYRF
jgi:opacity protein-like surface antigen